MPDGQIGAAAPLVLCCVIVGGDTTSTLLIAKRWQKSAQFSLLFPRKKQKIIAELPAPEA